jgi:hypothetical protein
VLGGERFESAVIEARQTRGRADEDVAVRVFSERTDAVVRQALVYRETIELPVDGKLIRTKC